MTKNIDFFIHEHNASQNRKIKALMRRFGPVGYSFYFMSLEYICSHGLEPVKLSENWELEEYADYLYILDTENIPSASKLVEIVEYACFLNLVDADLWKSNKELWCPKLLERLQARKNKKEEQKQKDAERKRKYRDRSRQEEIETGHDGTKRDNLNVPQSHALDKEEEKETEEEKDKRSEKEKSPHDAEVAQGFDYAVSHAQQSMNNHNTAWVKPNLLEAFKEHGNLDPAHILHCWREACDAGWEKGQAYVKKVFKNKLAEPPKQQQAFTSSPAAGPKKPSDADRLMAAKRIQNIFERDLIYETADLERVGEMIFTKHGPLVMSEFDPMVEVDNV